MPALEFPCLFLNADEWEQLSDKRSDPYFAWDLDSNDGALEKLDQVFTGNDETEELIHVRSFKNAVTRSCIAWYDKKRNADLERAKRLVNELCSNEKRWEPVSAGNGIHHADLTTGEALYTAVFAYDVLHPYVSDTEKELILHAICEFGLARYLKGLEDHDWWEHCNFNWGTCMHGNAGLAALCISNHNPELSEHVLHLAKEGIAYVVDNFPADGGWTEGVMYLGTTIGHLTDFIRPLFNLRNDDLGLLHNERILKTLEFRQYMNTADGGCFNLSNVDSDRSGGAAVHTYWWAAQLNRPDLIDGAQRMQNESILHRGLFYNVEALWMREAFQKEAPAQRSGLKHFRELDWVTWHGEKTWLAFRSGFSGGNHNNLDLGHFILGFGSERFLLDPGKGWPRTSQHNLPTLFAHEQTESARARIFRCRAYDRGFYLACNLQEAWPHRCAFYNRHLLLIDDAHLLVLDHMYGREGNRLTPKFHLQTQRRLDIEQRIIHGEHASMQIQCLCPTHLWQAESWPWKHSEVTTLSWRMHTDQVHSIHPMLLSFEDATASCSIDGDMFTLLLNDKEHRIHLADGRYIID